MSHKVVAGNWKMNLGPAETLAFFERFDPGLTAGPAEVLIFPPALSFAAAVSARPAGVRLGVQNVHFEADGAFTGELSVAMAREAGATHVLVGHSERRHLFGETDEMVARKTRAVLERGLTPVVCVGETLEERRAGHVDRVILRQLEAVLPVTQEFEASPLLVAYEPVWAIGTGETATPDDASAAHGTLRERLEEALGTARGSNTALLYGGSVKPANARELMNSAEVDGVLVGGASLSPQDFTAIIGAAAD